MARATLSDAWGRPLQSVAKDMRAEAGGEIEQVFDDDAVGYGGRT